LAAAGQIGAWGWLGVIVLATQVHLVFAALTPYLERVLALLSKKTILSYNKALR